MAAIHKDTDKAFGNGQILALSEEKLYNMIANCPHVQSRRSTGAIHKYTYKHLTMNKFWANPKKNLTM